MLSLIRVDDIAISVADDGPPTKIYANERLKLESSAIDELSTFRTIEGISRIAVTPDFHRGAGTPIGTTALIDRVYPRVVGGDIGCGLRLDATDLTDIDITRDLKDRIRHAFFGGGREIIVPNKADVLAYGLEATVRGRSASRIPRLQRSHAGGALGSGDVASILGAYAASQSERDNLLGTIGGGNHFVEIQRVAEVIDRKVAYDAGLKVGTICIMSHSGSLDLGHVVANWHGDRAKDLNVGARPAHGYLPLDGADGIRYVQDSYNAANFAMVNRAVMNSMLADVLNCDLSSIYDSPHNLVWSDREGYLHRKGSCPADTGELVMVPGSMGTRSCLAIGLGFDGTMSSSAHGAGRVLNRNSARAAGDATQVHVVTKIDHERARADVAAEIAKHLNEESPRAYKDVGEVINTSEQAGILRVVAWLEPLLTIKG